MVYGYGLQEIKSSSNSKHVASGEQSLHPVPAPKKVYNENKMDILGTGVVYRISLYNQLPVNFNNRATSTSHSAKYIRFT